MLAIYNICISWMNAWLGVVNFLTSAKEMSKPNMPNKNPAVFSTIFSKGRQHFAGWKTYIFENTTPNTRSFHSAVFPPTVPFLIMQKFPFLPSQKLIWNFTKTILSPQGSHDWFFSLTLFVLKKCHFLKKKCVHNEMSLTIGLF